MRWAPVLAAVVVAACASEAPRGEDAEAGRVDTFDIAPPPGATDTDEAVPPGARVPAVPAGDTLRGRISLVGSAPHPLILLMAPEGGPGARLVGDGAPPLASLSGVEVVVWGERAGETLRVERFRVRRFDGRPAVDGILTRAREGWALVMEGDTTALADPPPALLEHEGQRVWVAGDPSRTPEAFGVITPGG